MTLDAPTAAALALLVLASPALAQSECALSFETSDSDGSGGITQGEWASWRDQGFASMDRNGDGEIDRDEYANCMSMGVGDQMGKADRSADNMTEADMDKDGAVSAEEYRRAAEKAQGEAGQGGDGILVLRRYILVPARASDREVQDMSQSEAAARSAQMFRTLDKDNDGKLTQNEWSVDNSMMADLSESTGRTFDQMDADKSGKISRAEFTNATDLQWKNARSASSFDAAKAGGQTDGSDGSGASNGGAGSASGSASGSDGGEANIYYLLLAPMTQTGASN